MDDLGKIEGQENNELGLLVSGIAAQEHGVKKQQQVGLSWFLCPCCSFFFFMLQHMMNTGVHLWAASREKLVGESFVIRSF